MVGVALTLFLSVSVHAQQSSVLSTYGCMYFSVEHPEPKIGVCINFMQGRKLYMAAYSKANQWQSTIEIRPDGSFAYVNIQPQPEQGI